MIPKYIDHLVDNSSNIDEMREISRIYSIFAKSYSVEYCLKKTILNRFSDQKDNPEKAEMIEENLTVGGVTPNYDVESIHLGMVVSENLNDVNELNISNRIKKTDAKIYGAFKEVVWSRGRQANIETKMKLYTSLLRPSLLTGPNALPLTSAELEKIALYERQMLRKFFNLRPNNSSVTGRGHAPSKCIVTLLQHLVK